MTRPRRRWLIVAAAVVAVVGVRLWEHYPSRDPKFFGLWEVTGAECPPGHFKAFSLHADGTVEQIDSGWVQYFWSGTSAEFTIGDVDGPLGWVKKYWQYLHAPGMGRPGKTRRFRVIEISPDQFVISDRSGSESTLRRITKERFDEIFEWDPTSQGDAEAAQ